MILSFLNEQHLKNMFIAKQGRTACFTSCLLFTSAQPAGSTLPVWRPRAKFLCTVCWANICLNFAQNLNDFADEF